MELAKAVCAAGKPVIAVVTSGRPLLLEWLDEHCDAVVCSWFLGTESGHALADLLSGKTDFTGRL